MKNILLLLLTFITLITNGQNNKIIYIQPLGNVSDELISTIKSNVEKFYGYTCKIKTQVSFSKELLADSKTRYEASRILNKFKSKENILIITDKDIACKSGKIKEWGVFGLGVRPGSTCIISTFRMKANVTKAMLYERVTKVSIHELGHNLGIPHCTSDRKCLMNDANGTIKQVDQEGLYICRKCFEKIQKNKI